MKSAIEWYFIAHTANSLVANLIVVDIAASHLDLGPGTVRFIRPSVREFLFSNSHNPDILRIVQCRSALQADASMEMEGAIWMLLGRGADANFRGMFHWRPLQAALNNSSRPRITFAGPRNRNYMLECSSYIKQSPSGSDLDSVCIFAHEPFLNLEPEIFSQLLTAGVSQIFFHLLLLYSNLSSNFKKELSSLDFSGRYSLSSSGHTRIAVTKWLDTSI